MKRMGIFLVFSFLGVAVWAGESSAQLINYGRRNVYVKGNTPGSTEVVENVPEWARVLPEVKNREDEKYDTNRDGWLQSAEVKVMLRDVLVNVDKKGLVKIESDVLKEYDVNKDGYIKPNEIARIRQDVKG